MLDHKAEAVAARTREAPVTAGAGVQSTYTCSQIRHPSFFAPILICCFLDLFLGHHHLWMKGM